MPVFDPGIKFIGSCTVCFYHFGQKNFFQQNPFLKLSSWHDDPSKVTIFYFPIGFDYQSVPKATSFVSGKWIDEDLSTERLIPTFKTDRGTSLIPVIVSVKRLNTTNCTIDRLLRWNVPTVAPTVTDKRS